MRCSVVLFLTSTLGLSVHAFADAWSIGCAPETIQRSDPLLSPGGPSGHVHAVVGGNAFSRSMSDKLAATKATSTSCNTNIDHSNYWIPQLYHINADGKFELISFTGTGLYYQNRACNYTTTTEYCQNYEIPSLAPPEGIRFIAGDSTRRTFNSTDKTHLAISLNCNGHDWYNGFPPLGCKQLRAQVTYPSCWDGKNLDSSNHKSHVAYPSKFSGGVCPQSHPVAFFAIFSEWYFDLSPYADTKFVFANGDTTGNGFHADFINGWTDLKMLQDSFEHCDCPGGVPCTIETCPVRFQGAATGDNVQRTRDLITPAVFEEEIGLNGPIDKLPGNNPVYTGPVGPAVTLQ